MAKSPSEKKPSSTITPGSGSNANIVIIDKNGNKTETSGEVKDGATYDKNGNIMGSNHTGSGNLNTGNNGDGSYNNSGDYEKHWDSSTKPPTAIFVEKPGKEEPSKPSGGGGSSSGGGGGNYRPPKPTPPPPPPFIEFNEPVPTFKSDLKKIKQFSYFSGVDKIEARSVKINHECCFVSKVINIGELSEDEHIELDAVYSCDDNSTIEFTIIDGANEVPIVPIKDRTIKNEKLFFGKYTRFEVNKEKDVIVKNKTSVTTYTIEEAIAKDGIYNVSYTPASGHKCRPFNETIKIKVIIRSYSLLEQAPYVKSIKIRKYGGNAL